MINNSEKTLVSTFKGIATEENNINFFNDNKNKASKKSKTIFLSSCLTLLLLAGFFHKSFVYNHIKYYSIF